ncbi:uncharacterized protein [Solanum lycopersicum]|uniref:uncharacterized protein n=1 Tax=Solanum lycopersicum TaxID=4081 RepID=UPI00374994D1
MDAITLRYLINFIVHEQLEMHLMDVVTTYLYGSLDNEIYMKIPEGFAIPKSCNSKSREMYSIKLQRSLYGLKQSGRMWYNRLKKMLKRFCMDEAHPSSTPMVVRSLDVNKDPFRPQEKDEEILGSEVPYLSAVDALMYLSNTTRPDIPFVVNLLASSNLIDYADAGYLFDPHKARSQTSYVFICGGTAYLGDLQSSPS